MRPLREIIKPLNRTAVLPGRDSGDSASPRKDVRPGVRDVEAPEYQYISLELFFVFCDSFDGVSRYTLPHTFSKIAFWMCMRFSASSKMMEASDSSTESVVSTPRSAGRQCIKKLFLPVAAMSSSFT